MTNSFKLFFLFKTIQFIVNTFSSLLTIPGNVPTTAQVDGSSETSLWKMATGSTRLLFTTNKAALGLKWESVDDGTTTFRYLEYEGIVLGSRELTKWNATVRFKI